MTKFIVNPITKKMLLIKHEQEQIIKFLSYQSQTTTTTKVFDIYLAPQNKHTHKHTNPLTLLNIHI